MKELYLDCAAGAAGDMLCAALLELHPAPARILATVNALGLPGVRVDMEPAARGGLMGTHFAVTVNGETETQGAAHHRHTTLRDVDALLAGLPLPEAVRADARAVYALVAAAESRAHGCPVEQVHFHELGALDAAADILTCCLLLHELAPVRVTASSVCVGYGTVRCAHGLLPVPAPATAALLEGVPIYPGETEGELCTPTGAALLRHFVRDFGPPPPMTLEKTGCGMGARELPGRPNCLRALLGAAADEDEIVELCCNVDDMSPEAVGFAMQRLLDAGAPDAFTRAVGMKKNRPGLLLTCLCRPAQREEMVRLLFRHTSTLGIRETVCRRYVLRRETGTAETPYGPVRVKTAQGYGVRCSKAEYDDLARIATAHDLTLDEVRRMVPDAE